MTDRPKLYPFQREGVRWIEAHEGRALLADEPGLGKTVQALVWLRLRLELRPAVVVCPAAVKLQWAREARRWLHQPDVTLLSGERPDPTALSRDISVISYDVLDAWVDTIIKHHPSVLVLDEVHLAANESAKRTRAALKLGRRCRHVIGLSGTPILNRPIEAYTVIKLIAPGLFANKLEYGLRYCAGKRSFWHRGYDYSGASHLDELAVKLADVMLRRRKDDVLPELPAKVRTVVPLEMRDGAEYALAEADFRRRAKKLKPGAALAQVGLLRRLAAAGKMQQALAWVDDYLATGERLVLFCVHRATLRAVEEHLGRSCVVVHGGMSDRERDERVQSFQRGGAQVFAGIIDSQGRPAGIGINLTAARATAFLELQWSPGVLDQAEDRVHRIGQERDSVAAYYLIAAGTIEERIVALIDKKRRVLDQVVDRRESDERSMLGALLKQYKEER